MDLRDVIAKTIWHRHYAANGTYPDWDKIADPTKPIFPHIVEGDQMIQRNAPELYVCMQYCRDTADAIIAQLFYSSTGES